MIIDKFTVKYARKFNLGDYQSLDLSIMPTVQLEMGDDLDAVLKEVWEMCRKNIEHAARPIVAGKSDVTSQELFLGLPLEMTERKEIKHAD